MRKKRLFAAALCAALLLAALGGCSVRFSTDPWRDISGALSGRTPEDAAKAPAAGNTAPEAPSPAENAPTQEAPAETPPDTAPAEESAPQLTENEATAFLSSEENNCFLQSSYSLVTDVPLDEVFYTGAGLAIDPGEERLRAYEAQTGWEVQLDVTCVPRSALDAFLLRKTGHAYADFAPLSWPEIDGAFLHQHGDTLYEPFACTSLTQDGADLTITYRLDYYWAEPDDVGEVQLHWSEADGSWQFVSNLRYDR